MKITKQQLLIFLFFYVVVFILYYPSQNGILYINDAMINMYEFKYTGIKGILHSYNMIFLWYVPSVLYYVCYKLFGTNWLGWHVVLCLLHTINAVLIVSLIKKISTSTFNIIAILIGFVFLISTFQTEVVAWNALFHYSLAVLFLLLALFAQLNYFESNKSKYIFVFHIMYVCSLLCFEQAFLFPFVFLSCAVFIVPTLYPISWQQSLWKSIKVFFIGNVIAIGAYFIMNKLVFGEWIAHYGKEAHANIPLNNMYENLLYYHWKFLFYYRYLPDYIRQCYTDELLHKIFVIGFPICLSIIAFVFYKTKFYLKKEAKLILFLYSAFLFLLVPVLNLDRNFTFEIQSDRYGYAASMFFYAFLFITLYQFISKKVVYTIAIFSIALNCFLLIKSVSLWQKSGNLSLSLLKSYPLKSNQNAYLLNIPDNYAGVYTMRNGFGEGLSNVQNDKKFRYSSNDIIAWVNVFSNENETVVEKRDDATYFVRCLTNGKWYYFHGHGATDYETENYKVDFDEWNTAYNLTIKNKPKDTTYILQCYGDTWKIIDTLMPN